MPSNDVRHYYSPLNSSIELRSRPAYDKDRDAEWRHREADTLFVRKLALAFQRGDHLPAGSPKTLTLIG